MKKYEVRFRPLAEADLLSLYDYIADRGGVGVAGGYVDRIEAACRALEFAPKRGTRNDIYAGLRTIGFERRATIVFQVLKSEVIIVRVLYGGRDLETALEGLDK